MKRAAVFFDRDNTLIANDGYLGDPGGVVLVDGAADAIARVRGMGFSVVTFSNQSGVARGLFTEEAVHAVNARLDELLQEEDRSAVIARHEFCPYHPDGTVEKYRQDSDLRKPRPGMLLQAAERLDLDLKRSWVIGDAARDIEAGKAVGCRTILFSDPKLAASPATSDASATTPEFVVASLKAAVDIIVNETLGPLDVYIPPVTAPPVEAAVEPQPAAAVAATDVVPLEPSAASPQEPVAPETIAAEPVAAPPSPKKTPVDVAAKSQTPKSPRSSPKITFAERVKSGTFVSAEKKTSATAEASSEAGSQPPKATNRQAKPAAGVKAATAPRVRKPTFAERVRAGTFVPAGNAAMSLASAERNTEPEVAAPVPLAEATIDAPAVVPPPLIETPPESPAIAPASFTEPTLPSSPVTLASPVEATIESTTNASPPPIDTTIESPAVTSAPSVEATIESTTNASPPPIDTTNESPAVTSAPSVEATIESATDASPPPIDAPIEPPADMAPPSVEAAVESPATPATPVEAPNESAADTSALLTETPVAPPEVMPTPSEDAAIETPAITPPTPVETTTESTTDTSLPPVEAPMEVPAITAPLPDPTTDPAALIPAPAVEAAIESPVATISPTVENTIESTTVTPTPPVEPAIESPAGMPSPLVEATSESATVTSTPEIQMKTPTPNIAPPPDPTAPAAPAKKMTFAERVKAGTFQAERAAAAGVAAAPERPRRVMPMPGDKPQTQVNRVVESLTAVRPTEPVTPEEQLEPILQSILEELRQAREARPESDFSLVKLLTGIVQVLVLPALFFAYLNRGVAGDLQSMLMLATFLQTLVIALLIMGRS